MERGPGKGRGEGRVSGTTRGRGSPSERGERFGKEVVKERGTGKLDEMLERE